jgi:tRNA(Leu) C34 or U34 (ribose-2'-O)-methylase TrmL
MRFDEILARFPTQRHRGYCAIGLHKPKTPANIGNVLRAAGCYGVAMVGVSGSRYRPHETDTLKAWRHMPLIEVDDLQTIVPYDCVPVAVELLPNAKSLQNYHHPERAFYIFGPEDGSLGPDVIKWCRDVVYVPTVFCMNLAACVNVLLYDRIAKQARAMPN